MATLIGLRGSQSGSKNHTTSPEQFKCQPDNSGRQAAISLTATTNSLFPQGWDTLSRLVFVSYRPSAAKCLCPLSKIALSAVTDRLMYTDYLPPSTYFYAA
jgi:hypothetical protein